MSDAAIDFDAEVEAHLLAQVCEVGDLVEGFETPFGLELLATVHWVTTRERAKSVEEAIAKTYAWNDRKKRFSHRQIGIAYDALLAKGWLDAA